MHDVHNDSNVLEMRQLGIPLSAGIVHSGGSQTPLPRGNKGKRLELGGSAYYNKNMLMGLPSAEVRVLQLRYGLLDGQAYTLEEVERKMGVTRERARQIEAQALSRLMTN